MKPHRILSTSSTRLLLMLIGLSSTAFAKSVDDVVILNNGDRFTGEIKNLEHGELEFKSSYMRDSVRLNWAAVARLESKDQYLVLLTSGRAFTASIRLDETTGPSNSFRINSGTGSIGVGKLEVMKIRSADQRFWAQLKGSIDYGFSYTSGNSSYQTQFAAAAAYDGEGYQVSSDISSVFNTQSEGSSTRRNTLNTQYWRLFTPKWFYGGMVDMLNSDQQSLKLRTTLGAGIGRRIVQTSRTTLAAFSGLAVTRERYSSDEPRPKATNAEALVGLEFSTFRFRTLDISSRLLVWPSLSDPGRVRMGLNSNFRIELAKNLFWNLNVYENFDSRPQVNANRNDLGITNSFGWTF
jgi:putative salt-induced outer membrane protein YdiY